MIQKLLVANEVRESEAYLRSVCDHLTRPASTALRVAQARFEDLPFCLPLAI
jgi:hypothetical protein